MEKFRINFNRAFKITQSPLIINLDHNTVHSMYALDEMMDIVRATAQHVSGYKLNFQSLLSCLMVHSIDFIHEIKNIYHDIVGVDPLVWLDQKLCNIPNTDYESAIILFRLGFDGLNVMLHVGRDSVAAVQLAANQNDGAVVHVINMTHPWYVNAKREYYQSNMIDKIRKHALSTSTCEVQLDTTRTVAMHTTGVIEPTTRPF